MGDQSVYYLFNIYLLFIYHSFVIYLFIYLLFIYLFKDLYKAVPEQKQ